MEPRTRRRRFLELAAASGTAALAGCGLLGDEPAEDGSGATPTASGGPTATEEGTPSPRRLSWGDPATTPQGLGLAVLGGSFSETYSGAENNETITPPEDRKFVVVTVEVTNPESETIRLPSLGYFRVRANGNAYEVLLGDSSVQLPVEPDTTRRIRLPFLVPASVGESDVAVWWEPVYENGRLAVVWSGS
jgi:hypothetical protein